MFHQHFRPKAGYTQRETDALRQPGYYWLAYEWANLFYSCTICNQRFKRNQFPLKDGRRRARSHRHDLAREQPLLVDPGRQDPAAFLGFRGEYPYAVDGRPEGAATIRVLGLDREELAEVRRDRLARLKKLVVLRRLLEEKVKAAGDPAATAQLAELESLLQACREDAGEYAAMCRAYLDAAG